MIKHILGEDILLSIYPEKREGFLGTVEDLREETAMQGILLALVEDFVGLGEFEAIFFLYRSDAKYLVESLHTLEIAPAQLRALIRLKFKLSKAI